MIGLKPSVIDAVAAVFLLCACAGSCPESSATGMQPGTSACNAVYRAQQSGPLRLNINRDGSLVDLQGNIAPLASLSGKDVTIQVPPKAKATFETIERSLQLILEQGARDLSLLSPTYVYAAGKLFYAVPESARVSFSRPTEPPPGAPRLIPAGMDPGQLQGHDASVQPPVLNLDVEKIARSGKASGSSGSGLRYILCVNEKGEVHTVVSKNAPQAESAEILAALRKVIVKSPGRRGDKSVPTAIPVVIPIR